MPSGSLIILGLALAALGLIAWWFYRAGRIKSKAETLEQNAKAVATAQEVRQEVQSRTPEENRERLKSWGKS